MFNKYWYGIDIGTNGIRGIKIAFLPGNQIKIADFLTLPSSEPLLSGFYPGVEVEGVLVQSLLRELIKKLKVDRRNRLSMSISDRISRIQLISMEELPDNPEEAEKLLLWKLKKSGRAEWLEQSFLDYYCQSNSSPSSIIVELSEKEILEKLTRIFLSNSIKPRGFDINSLHLLNFLEFQGKLSPGKCVVLVNGGKEHTSVMIVRNLQLELFRMIQVGGENLSQILSDKLEIGFSDAENFKKSHSFVPRIYSQTDSKKHEDSSASDVDVVDRFKLVKPVFEELLAEVAKCIQFYQEGAVSSVEKIILCGNWCNFTGLDGYFNNYFDIHTENLEELLKENNFTLEMIPAIGSVISLRDKEL